MGGWWWWCWSVDLQWRSLCRGTSTHYYYYYYYYFFYFYYFFFYFYYFFFYYFYFPSPPPPLPAPSFGPSPLSVSLLSPNRPAGTGGRNAARPLVDFRIPMDPESGLKQVHPARWVPARPGGATAGWRWGGRLLRACVRVCVRASMRVGLNHSVLQSGLGPLPSPTGPSPRPSTPTWPSPPPVHPYSQQPHRPAPHPAHVRATSAPVGHAGAGFRRGADGITGDHGAGTAKHIVFSVRARGWIGGGAAAAAPEPASSRCQIVRVHACLRVRARACPSSPGTRSAWPCCSTAPSPCPSGKTFWCVCVCARARARARACGFVYSVCASQLC